MIQLIYISNGTDRWPLELVSKPNQTQMQMASLAFVGAREEFPQFSAARRKMLQTISSHTFADYSFTMADVTVTCDVEQQGYSAAGVNFLIPAAEGECSFYLQFTMSVKRSE